MSLKIKLFRGKITGPEIFEHGDHRIYTKLFGIMVLFFNCRHASATRCEVSLPQHVNSAACMSLRKAAIAKNQEIYTYKFDPAVHGFALLNMTVQELGAVALKDPFMAYYTTAYVTMTRASNSLHQLYQNLTSELGEINQISEYLALSEFFQTGLEPIVGVNLAFSFLFLSNLSLMI